MNVNEYIVGVIGAGLMGNGLVQLLTTTPDVKKIYWCSARKSDLSNQKSELLNRINHLAKKGRIDSQIAQVASDKLIIVREFDALESCNFIHEVVSESINIKRDILIKLNEVKNPNALVASNTSSISITELAMSLSDPTKFIGMHFFNP